MSRRAADTSIKQQRIRVNGKIAMLGSLVQPGDAVTLDGEAITLPEQAITIMLNKPIGYVVSRDGQGSNTIYDLLPAKYHSLKPVGRLDKDSSGLLILTNDGQLANQLTHPSFNKEKVYEVQLDKPLTNEDKTSIEQGIELEDGLSVLRLQGEGKNWIITMHEGRNRQIRRTFETLGYTVAKLHRTQFGAYKLNNLEPGNNQILD